MKLAKNESTVKGGTLLHSIKNSEITKVILLSTLMLMFSALSYAGPIGDIVSGAGEGGRWFIRVIFGAGSAILAVAMFNEFRESQQISKAELKVIAGICCVALAIKPSLMTDAITGLGI